MTEDIYRNLVCSIDPAAPESVHLCDYPAADGSMIDPELEKDMGQVLKIVVLGRAARNTSGIKNRQPIGEMIVKCPVSLPAYFTDIIADELNVKNVSFTDDVSGYTSYEFKPQLRSVGPKYGRFLGEIKAALASIDGAAAWNELQEKGELHLADVDDSIILSEDDLLISVAQTEGFATESSGDVTVVLDTRLTPELIEEGLVREIVSKVQTMRKEAGFEVMDHITVTYEGDDEVAAVFSGHSDEISHDVLALDIRRQTPAGYTKDWNINGHKVLLGVEKHE